jgi:branched-chain amino acid transport system ATP-binding protein
VTEETLLSLTKVTSHYGPVQVLFDINLEVRDGEIVCLLGGNASGKSTIMKTIIGTHRESSGEIGFRGEAINSWSPARRVGAGIAIVPEARRLFPELTVRENLEMGAFVRGRDSTIADSIDHVMTLFPRLRERAEQEAGTLSGGEQQMVAMARALMPQPKLIIMDEPSMGLAPMMIDTVFDLIEQTNGLGIAILMVEQNANMALAIASRGYVLQNGHIVMQGAAAALAEDKQMRSAYLGE